MLRQCCMLLRKAPNLHLSSRQSLEPPPYFFTHEPQPHARTSSFPKPKIRESASPTRNSTHLKTPTQQPKLPTSKIPCCSSFQCIYMYITKLASDNNQWRDPPSPLPPSFPASPSFFLTPPFLHNHHPHLPPIPPYSSKNGGNTPRVSNQRPRKNSSQYAAGKTHLVRFDLVPLARRRIFFVLFHPDHGGVCSCPVGHQVFARGWCTFTTLLVLFLGPQQQNASSRAAGQQMHAQNEKARPVKIVMRASYIKTQSGKRMR